MHALLADLRYGLRVLRKSPAFTLAALLSLALGIGANTAMFTVVNALFFHTAAVDQVDRVVMIHSVDDKNPGYMPVSRDNLDDFSEQCESYTGVASFARSWPVLQRGELEQPVFTNSVSGNYFEVLRIEMLLGSPIDESHDQAEGANPVAVISERLWRDRFAADPNIVGETMRFGGQPFVIIGVADGRFRGTNNLLPVDAWVPMSAFPLVDPRQGALLGRRGLTQLGLARLRPGVSLDQAQAEANTIFSRLAEAYPEENEGRRFELMRLSDASLDPNMRDAATSASVLLMAVVGLVLLIACANVANLLLARAAARAREVAIRQAIGCSPRRLLRQLLTESVLLALIGAGLGLVFAFAGLEGLELALKPDEYAFEPDFSLDLNVALFTAGLAVFTGITFGLAPAVASTRTDLVSALKGQARGAANGQARRLRIGGILVIAQVALSTVALVGSGLFVRSLSSAHAIDPGFEHEHTAIMGIEPPRPQMSEDELRSFQDQIVAAAAAIPGVEAAGRGEAQPLNGNMMRTTYIIGYEGDDDGVLINVNGIDEHYLETLEIPLLDGRNLTAADDDPEAEVVIVNRTMAERYWPGQSPVGKQISFQGSDERLTVIGVTADVKYLTLGEDPLPYIYTSTYSRPTPRTTLYLRFAGDPETQLASAQLAIREVNQGAPLLGVATMAQIIDQSLGAAQGAALLLGAFGGVALLLSITGIYGLMTYSVSRRTREIGVRMALGAPPSAVRAMILRESMTLVGIGLLVGAAASVVLSRPLAPMLFDTSTTDPLAYLGASALLLLAALVTAYFPARRATRVNPMEALKSE